MEITRHTQGLEVRKENKKQKKELLTVFIGIEMGNIYL
jgi:hypothetical protein